MSLNTPRDLFIHELSDSMSAEHIVLQMLGELEQETQNSEVRDAVKHHRKETEQQIANLEKVFDLLGEKPEKTTCHAAEGLKKEHDALKEEAPPELVLELGNLAGAAKTEHYEIAAYTGLIEKARAMGQTEATQLLQQNLQEEQQMLRQVEQIAQQMTQQMAAMAGARSGQQASATM